MNILLINLLLNGVHFQHRKDATSISHRIYPPLGLISLAGSVIEKDYVSQIKCLDYNRFSFDACCNEDEYYSLIYQKLLEHKSFNPDVVCVSLMLSASYSFFKLAARCVKTIFDRCTLICGGIHATATAGLIFEQDKDVDYVICGEGEEALPKLLDNIAENKTENIPGVHHRDNMKFSPETGQFEIAPVARDIDLNLRAYDCFDMALYTSGTATFNLSKKGFHAKNFPVMASRGCPVRCTFCAAHVTHGRIPRWRSLDNIRDEVIFLYEKYGVTEIQLKDDNFLPKQKTLELFNMLRKLPIPDFKVNVQNMSANHIDNEIIDALANVNSDTLILAIESGAGEIQKRIKKHCDLDKAIELVKYAKSIGLNTWCFYIIGFPGETIEQMRETIDYSIKMNSDWVSYSTAVPYPGTEMYDEFVAMGYIDDSPLFWNSTTIRDRTFDTAEIKAADIKEMAYVANLKYNFINNPHIRDKKYEEAEKIFLDFINVFDFHIFAFDCLRRIYNLTRQYEKANETIEKMRILMNTNPTSKGFEKYLYLLDEEIREYLAKYINHRE